MPFLWLADSTVQYILDALARIEKRQVASMATLTQTEAHIMAAIDDALTAAEAAAKKNADAEDAVITLLGTLSDQIKAAAQGSTDPAVTARVQALADALSAKSDALAAAIVANTPAA